MLGQFLILDSEQSKYYEMLMRRNSEKYTKIHKKVCFDNFPKLFSESYHRIFFEKNSNIESEMF